MDLIREIEKLFAGSVTDSEELGNLGNLAIPKKVLEYAVSNQSMAYLKGHLSDEATAYSNYRYDVNFDSLGYLDRWLNALDTKIERSGGEVLRQLCFDYVWVLGAYASDVRGRGDRNLGLQIFSEAFEVGKMWPRSWAFASLLCRFPAFATTNPDLSTMVLLYAGDIFRLTEDRFQAAMTLTNLGAHRLRCGEWEGVESHAREAALAADNSFDDHRGSDLLRRIAYIQLASAQLQLGKFKDLGSTLDLIPELIGVSGHDLITAGLLRGAMHWDLDELQSARSIYVRELDRVSIRFPDLKAMVLYYFAFMESHIGDPRRSQELVAEGIIDLDGDPTYRRGLERISNGTASFEEIAGELVKLVSMPPLTPPRIAELEEAA